MGEQVRIRTITLRTEGRTAKARFELTDRLSDECTYEIGIEYRGSGELHQAAVRRTDGVVDASSFASFGGTLHQVSESFDIQGNFVDLVISRPFTVAELASFELAGYLDVNGSREQSDVHVELI
jgi:hypothetical protein